MERKCIRCGKKFRKAGNTKYCTECSFLNRHKSCITCGRLFIVPEGYIGKTMKECPDCRPKDAGMKTNELLVNDAINAKKAGMTYGKYQQWKYMQQCKEDRMIKRLNKEIKKNDA